MLLQVLRFYLQANDKLRHKLVEWNIPVLDMEQLPTTMYKNNSRDGSKFKVYSPLQLSCKLTEKCYATRYYSYTNR